MNGNRTYVAATPGEMISISEKEQIEAGYGEEKVTINAHPLLRGLMFPSQALSFP